MKIAQIREAFLKSTDRYFSYRDDCLDVARYLRTELAKYLGLKAEEIPFAKPDAKFFEGYDDPHDAFIFDASGAIRIVFGIVVSGHSDGFPNYRQGIPVRIRKKSGQLFVETEWSNHEFGLGDITNLNAEKFCEYVFQEILTTVQNGFDQIFDGREQKSMGYHTLFKYWQNPSNGTIA